MLFGVILFINLLYNQLVTVQASSAEYECMAVGSSEMYICCHRRRQDKNILGITFLTGVKKNARIVQKHGEAVLKFVLDPMRLEPCPIEGLFYDDRIFVVGYDVDHSPPSSNIGDVEPSVVGVAYNACRQYQAFNGNYVFQEAKQEAVNAELLQNAVIHGLEMREKQRRDDPVQELVFVGRDGLSVKSSKSKIKSHQSCIPRTGALLPDAKARFNLRGHRYHDPSSCKKWKVFNGSSQNIQEPIRKLMIEAQTRGLDLAQPEINSFKAADFDNKDNWTAVFDDLLEYGYAFVLVINPRRDRNPKTHYMFKCCELIYGVQTQHVHLETLQKPSCHENIVHNVNVKLAGLNYNVRLEPCSIQDLFYGDRIFVVGYESKIKSHQSCIPSKESWSKRSALRYGPCHKAA